MGDESAELIGRRVLFSGRVQGVGFRFTTCDLAREFEVTGYVKNLADGRVELVCEGRRAETVRFVEAVRQAMHNYVGEVQSSEMPASGRYGEFGLRF